MKKSISVFVPAYNEEKNIRAAIQSIIKAVTFLTTDYEILVLDDCSTDRTADIVKAEIRKYKHIRLIHNAQNQGIGKSFKKAIALANKNYITVFPGDNDMSSKSLIDLFKKIEAADLVMSYPIDQKHRSIKRRILSFCFIKLMNIIFKLNVRYYNGPFITKLSLIKNTFNLKSKRFLIYAELKLRLIRMGYSYLEIPFEHTGRAHGMSKAVSIYNLLDTLSTIAFLMSDNTLNKKR